MATSTGVSRRDFLKLAGLAGFGSRALDALAAGTRAVVEMHGLAAIHSGDGIHLAASQWINDRQLPGVRLRWTLPLMDESGEVIRCLPETVDIYRGNTPEFVRKYFMPASIDIGTAQTIVYPTSLWDGRIVKVGSLPDEFVLKGRRGEEISSPAVYFVYTGPEATLYVEDLKGECVYTGSLGAKRRTSVYIEAHAIRRLRLLHHSRAQATLTDACCVESAKLDVSDQKLATLQVRTVFSDRVPFKDVKRRLKGSAAPDAFVTTMPRDDQSLDDAEWHRMIDLAADVAGPSCSGALSRVVNDEGTEYRPLDFFATAIASRWEYSVFAGFGFRDGPDGTRCKTDRYSAPLNEPPRQDVFYRLVANFAGGEEICSNLVFVRAGTLPDLKAPTNAHFESDEGARDEGRISLTPSVSVFDKKFSKEIEEQKITGSTNLVWAHNNEPLAAGVLALERWRSHIGERETETWCFATEYSGLWSTGRISRIINCDLFSELKATLRTFDGWDRLSAPVDVAPCRFYPTTLQAPPVLTNASYLPMLRAFDIQRFVPTPPSQLSTRQLSAGRETLAGWTPDAITNQLLENGVSVSLTFFRRLSVVTEYAVLLTGVEEPTQLGRSKVSLEQPVPPNVSFEGGMVVQGKVAKAILSAGGSSLYILDGDAADFELNGTSVGCGPRSQRFVGATMDRLVVGDAFIIANEKHPSLWKEVPETWGGKQFLSSRSLAEVFRVLDEGPPPQSEPDSVIFAWRVEAAFRGRNLIGPLSAPVNSIRTPPPPRLPGSFFCIPLGHDYYGRLAIKLVFEDPPSREEAIFEVFWCRSEISVSDAFERSAKPGNLGLQRMFENKILFDILDTEKSNFIDEEYTIGVREVLPSGIEGPFTTAKLSLKSGNSSERR